MFLLRQLRFLLVQYPSFLTVRVSHCVIDPDIPQVQRIFQNPETVRPVRAVGHIHSDITVGWNVLTIDVPFSRILRELYPDCPSLIERDLHGFLHELLNVFLIDPCRAKANINL